jgi:inosine/xanthosine triphosphate pyrophosphatase family protein
LVEAGLPLSLNTDDPGLFVSSLPGEFSAMYGALAAAGMEHRQILRWLDERIGDARHASFLSPQVPIGAASPVLEPAEMNALFRYQPGG